MCGIVGAISDRNVVPMLLAGLSRLEYRGYDSSGFALVSPGKIERIRVAGRVAHLAERAGVTSGTAGIAHTRWATHGIPSEANAHPHLGGDSIMVVHNGIIENHTELKNRLIKDGYLFTSETDTEVIAHLIHQESLTQPDLLKAVQTAVAQLTGAFGLGVASKHDPDHLICARKGSPLVLGLGFGEQFFASDIAALLPVTQRIIYLEEGDIAEVSRQEIKIFDLNGNAVHRPARTIDAAVDSADLGQYRHYMQKEIFEQPDALSNTLEPVINQGFSPELFGPAAREIFLNAPAVRIVACGSSYHAGLVARYWIEEFTGLPVSVDIASEYRYRINREPDNTLIVAISQSGETADLLAAMRSARERGQVKILALCNVPHSTLVREADLVALTHAGMEIGVASTKAFTTQLAMLYVLAGTLAQTRESLPAAELASLSQWLIQLPAQILELLSLDAVMDEWAQELSHDHNALYLGRHTLFPIALEGALKLKEIAYIHAEGYAAGELKHGPLALVDEHMPVIVCVSNDRLFDKLLSNLREVEARGGRIYLIAEPGCEIAEEFAHRSIILPKLTGPLASIAFTIPLQLLSYHTACRKGTDVDKPRNLAKSVTVE
ncbi:MAG: glutamine--fructose-6-phosphate transaminase (isomerizing) [Iodobacter sp.]